MKKTILGLILWVLPVFVVRAETLQNSLSAESLSPAWAISTANPMYITAYNIKHDIELMMYIDDLAPAGIRCQKNRVLKDVKFTVTFFKKPNLTDRDLDRVVRKTRMKVIRNKKTYLPKARVIDLYDDDVRQSKEEPVRLGKLEFTSPFTCHNLDGVEFVIYNIEVNGRDIPELRFKVEYLPQVGR